MTVGANQKSDFVSVDSSWRRRQEHALHPGTSFFHRAQNFCQQANRRSPPYLSGGHATGSILPQRVIFFSDAWSLILHLKVIIPGRHWKFWPQKSVSCRSLGSISSRVVRVSVETWAVHPFGAFLRSKRGFCGTTEMAIRKGAPYGASSVCSRDGQISSTASIKSWHRKKPF
jgi:hypothetical protein